MTRLTSDEYLAVSLVADSDVFSPAVEVISVQQHKKAAGKTHSSLAFLKTPPLSLRAFSVSTGMAEQRSQTEVGLDVRGRRTLGLANCLFFGVGEPGDLSTVDNGFAIFLGTSEDDGRMADCRDWFGSFPEIQDEPLGDLVLVEVQIGAMSVYYCSADTSGAKGNKLTLQHRRLHRSLRLSSAHTW